MSSETVFLRTTLTRTINNLRTYNYLYIMENPHSRTARSMPLRTRDEIFDAEIIKHCSVRLKRKKNYLFESRCDCMFKSDYLVYREVKLEP